MNTRWLVATYPAQARQIQRFAWVQDGVSGLESSTINELIYLAVADADALEAVLALPWVQDSISKAEHDIINRFDVQPSPLSWVQMPFLESIETADSFFFLGMDFLNSLGVLSYDSDHPIFEGGITDEEAILIAGTATFNYNPDEQRRILEPGTAVVETVTSGTELTPNLKVSIIRTDGQDPWPGTVHSVRDLLAFVESKMEIPLPTDHLILLLNGRSWPGYEEGGSIYDHAIRITPPDEQQPDGPQWDTWLVNLAHVFAYYYWDERYPDWWLSEGMATVFETMFRRDILGQGVEETQAVWGGCSPFVNLMTLATTEFKGLDPNDPESLAQGNCWTYLGHGLFVELLDTMGDEMFAERLAEFYRTNESRDRETVSAVDVVRQVFPNHGKIVDKHWAGQVNAPENRP